MADEYDLSNLYKMANVSREADSSLISYLASLELQICALKIEMTEFEQRLQRFEKAVRDFGGCLDEEL